jgi:alpha,alpha-trehalase
VQTDSLDLDRLKTRWRALDDAIRGGWDSDMRTAQEQDINDKGPDWTWTETISKISGHQAEPRDNSQTLLFLPFPFRPGAGKGAFPEMFAWDSYFVILGMLSHRRFDLIRGMLLNQLFMIMRHGKVLNANRTYFLGRSQPPLHADAIWRYFEATGDCELLMLSYPLLCQEYRQHWLDGDHSTPTGLTTHNDTKDRYLRPELAAEAESGLDFCALFDGDIRKCVPVALNCQLVRYCEVLGLIADKLGFAADADEWRYIAKARGQRIRDLCWNEEKGFFFEYDFVNERQIPVWSLCAYWTVWANVATETQTRRVAEHLSRFEQSRGLTVTDKLYPSPHPEFPVLQWAYPYCWPPLITMVLGALSKTSASAYIQTIGINYLSWVIERYEETGTVWEKYLAVPDATEQDERYGTVSFYGWSCASVVQIGRLVGLDE